MSDSQKRKREIMKNSVFCFARPNGEGFVDKVDCECNLKGKKCCQAYKDKEKFHSYFEGLTYKERREKRSEIIELIRDEFKDSQWYKDNVIE